MWRERFSGRSTPAAPSPPPHDRSYSPAPRRAGHLAPGPIGGRPAFSPRSSSLSLASLGSTASHSVSGKISNGHSLKERLSSPLPPGIQNPLLVLEQILGASDLLKSTSLNEATSDLPARPADIIDDIDFNGLSLEEFASQDTPDGPKAQESVAIYDKQSIAEYEKERDKFEDLHRSIAASDEVLKSVEQSLANFQAELGIVSAEIETLQSRSTALNTQLENRKKVEQLLGPAVEDISISPAVVRKISEGPIDEQWIKALEELERRSKIVQAKSKDEATVKAIEDVLPLLEKLSNKAVERIRDFLVAQIKGLRSPNINAQIIQQQSFLRYKELYSFLHRLQPRLGEEIFQAYVNTMRWYYIHHFTRYRQALDKVKLFVIDKHDVLGQDDPGRRSNIPTAKGGGAPHDAFNLGRRILALKNADQSALTSYLAEEDKSVHYLEHCFRSFNLALVDNASSEYSFLSAFFSSHSIRSLSGRFAEIFEPTFSLGQGLTKALIENTYDCLGILLCVRLNQHFAFELQRRKVPTLDGYINATNMLLWPRFQILMDSHSDSIRHLTASSGRFSSSPLSLSVTEAAKQSAAPHFLTQRFAQFMQSILLLSAEAGDDEPVSNSLARLRTDFEAFLTKLSKSIGGDGRKRERFLGNNYSLVLTIIGDTHGKLAEEQKQHFEALKSAFARD